MNRSGYLFRDSTVKRVERFFDDLDRLVMVRRPVNLYVPAVRRFR